MKQIVLFGAGKSATVLIEYLLAQCAAQNWNLIVVDANIELAQSKIGTNAAGKAVSFDIHNVAKRNEVVGAADIVISLLPPSLHILVAQSCLAQNKNLLTASYIDEALEALRPQIEEQGLLFLCEMGLDPGIDHMSAKKLIDEIEAQGGIITSFLSHCGGLVAPAHDNNPWHYKISWNPRNVVHAGKDGAVFLKKGVTVQWSHPELFAEKRYVTIQDELHCWYPNRDSLRYLPHYNLPHCQTFIRTTLRHPDFIYGWKNIIDLKLTDTEVKYDTDGKTLEDFFKEHMDENNFGGWLEQKLKSQLEGTNELLNSLVQLVEIEKETEAEGVAVPEDMMLVNEQGDLQNIDLDSLKNNAAATIALRMHESKLTLQQLFFLGMADGKTVINKGACSAADVLQFALEKKLALAPGDRDMIVMQHEIEYELNGNQKRCTSSLVLEGQDEVHTAMATTVGLPLGIAAMLILEGKIAVTGLQLPTLPEIYTPVLSALAARDIRFQEQFVE